MVFDWLTFFGRYGIEYEPARREWVDIWCPWCGGANTHHLGVSIKYGIYHCWHGHSGKAPHPLIIALLGCSNEEADRIVGSGDASYARSDASFATDTFRRLGLVLDEPKYHRGVLSLLPEFKPIQDRGLCRSLVLPYLEDRGYTSGDALLLAAMYDLRFAANGPFAYRIIVPVVLDGKVVNWTGRTVARSDRLRYKSLSTDIDVAARQGVPAAPVNIKDTLLDFDNIRRGGDTLVITEGPFDALRVGFLGRQLGVRSTCLFGKESWRTKPSTSGEGHQVVQRISPAQIDMLASVRARYRKMAILLDRDAGFDTYYSLPEYLNVKPMHLPAKVKDPAELTDKQFFRLFS